MFVMHNPVMWADPTGLFAWNEANDHWFNIQSEVWGAGGSIDFHNGFINVSVFGVNVRFDSHQDGVQWGSYRSCVRVRADLFYSSVVAAAQEMIFLGGHTALHHRNPFPADHLHISMFMSASRFNYLSGNNAPDFLGYFSGRIRWGNVHYATLSGGKGGQSAISEVNRLPYLDRAGLNFVNHLHTGTGKIAELFAAHNHFMGHHSTCFTYAILPVPGWLAQEFNSTSIAIGLLNAVGLDHGMTDAQLRRAIGINRQIAPHYFGR